MSNKHQLAVAAWPDRPGSTLGGNDFPPYGDCDSFVVQLRSVPNDPSADLHFMSTEARTMLNIGLYVWLHADGIYVVDVRIIDGFGGAPHLGEAERLVAKLRSLCKRMPPPEAGLSFREYLARVLKALRITKEMQYRHGEATVAPVAPERIANCFDAKLARLQGRSL